MKWPKFSAYDFYAVIVLFILDYYLLTNWDDFEDCENPIKWWLLADYNIMFFTRIIYVMKNSGYTRKTKVGLNVVFFGLLLPLLICFTVTGYMWEESGYKCIPDHMVPWSFLLWLCFTAVTTLLIFIKMLFDWRKYRRLKQYISKMDENQSLIQTDYSVSHFA